MSEIFMQIQLCHSAAIRANRWKAWVSTVSGFSLLPCSSRSLNLRLWDLFRSHTHTHTQSEVFFIDRRWKRPNSPNQRALKDSFPRLFSRFLIFKRFKSMNLSLNQMGFFAETWLWYQTAASLKKASVGAAFTTPIQCCLTLKTCVGSLPLQYNYLVKYLNFTSIIRIFNVA